MANLSEMGTRRFGAVNWLGMWTLMQREIRRFLNVWSQTIMAPVINAALFLLIFSIAVGSRRGDVMGVPFLTFITPGIMMMTVIQQGFSNTSSSITSAKMMGNIVDTLMPPLSASEILVGYLGGAITRGALVALVIMVLGAVVMGVVPQHPLWLLVFVLMGGAFMGALGLIAGIYANKFDQLATITTFIVTPLAFLSGTFYSIDALPPVLRAFCHVNPIFYLIDGARYGMIGVSDSAPWIGVLVCLSATVVVVGICWRWLDRGYRIKS